MITAVCLNPSFDKTVHLDGLKTGEVNRIKSVHTGLGGKGINVARVLQKFGYEAQCLGFLGKDNQERFRTALKENRLRSEWIEVDGDIRVNTKIIDDVRHEITELNEPGPGISNQKQKDFLQLLAKQATGSHFCILSGRIPAGVPQDYYYQCMCVLTGIPVVVDTTGESLLRALCMKPCLIKPNLQELEDITGKRLATPKEIEASAKQLMKQGAQKVLVSLGKDGAMLITGQHTYYSPAINVPVSNTVGAGDTMVGAYISAIAREWSDAEALRFATAAAGAAVMISGTEAPDREACEKLMKQATVTEL